MGYFFMKRAFATILFFVFFLQAHVHGHTSHYQKWLRKTTDYLNGKGKIVSTALGDIQVVTYGKGPVVLSVHGGFGGWDQGELVALNIAKHGFQVISVSRPGYLSTPIATNPLLFEETTAADQADLLAALLDTLHIPKALCIGFSAGAPVVYEFGLRYPDKTSAVVLECIGANPNEDGLFYLLLGSLLATETAAIDFQTYLLHLGLHKDYYSIAKQFLPLDTELEGHALRVRTNYVLSHCDQYHFLKKMLKATIPISPRLLGTINDFLGVEYWTETFTPPTLEEYSLPTLIIQAIDDSNGYYPTAQSIHSDLPTSELISVQESGHFIWLGPYAKSWEKKLIEFLKLHS